jgi:tetratricopeptide (TPR) repeat protein
MTTEQVLELWRAEFARRPDGDAKLEAAICVGACLSALGRHAEAFAVLDEVPLTEPHPGLMAMWLNNRAYALVMLDRAHEAIPLLDDAILLPDDQTPFGRSTLGCITGPRGIVLLHLGQLRVAEELLLRALDIGRDAVAEEGKGNGPIAEMEQRLTAERWYWLSDVADRTDRPAEARRRLELAAAAAGPFAERASARLAGRPMIR